MYLYSTKSETKEDQVRGGEQKGVKKEHGKSWGKKATFTRGETIPSMLRALH